MTRVCVDPRSPNSAKPICFHADFFARARPWLAKTRTHAWVHWVQKTCTTGRLLFNNTTIHTHTHSTVHCHTVTASPMIGYCYRGCSHICYILNLYFNLCFVHIQPSSFTTPRSGVSCSFIHVIRVLLVGALCMFWRVSWVRRYTYQVGRDHVKNQKLVTLVH